MQSVVSNIRDNGAAIQWSADPTERLHITEIKQPSRSTNNRNHESQICRHLDRVDKCRRFDLATAVREARVDLRALSHPDHQPDDGDDDDIESQEHLEDGQRLHIVDSTAELLSQLAPVTQLTGTTRNNADYYTLARELHRGAYSHAPTPFRTFLGGNSALHLTRDPTLRRMSVDEVAEKFQLPDLRGALADYLSQVGNGTTHLVGGRRFASNRSPLPFETLDIWSRVRVQNRAYHAPHAVLPAQTINASAPSNPWEFGRSDAVIINADPGLTWPQSGLKGMTTISPYFAAN
jgi:hypothetical protein